MATARQLLNLLNKLPDKDLDIELSMPGHYGEHHSMSLPEVTLVRLDSFSGSTKFVLAFPLVDVGPEPD